MDKKEREISNDLSPGTARGLMGPSGSEPMDLNYFREARLFLAKDRATLTFYVDQEVASIHYDLIRDEIFYRGHNVKNMTMSQAQWESLQKFEEYLGNEPRADRLRGAYKACLDHLMTDHGLPA